MIHPLLAHDRVARPQSRLVLLSIEPETIRFESDNQRASRLPHGHDDENRQLSCGGAALAHSRFDPKIFSVTPCASRIVAPVAGVLFPLWVAVGGMTVSDTPRPVPRGLPATVSPVLPAAPLTSAIVFFISYSQPSECRGDFSAGYHPRQTETTDTACFKLSRGSQKLVYLTPT
jgi:hypothetical protein